MNALQKLWATLATHSPADHLAALQAQYRADAADSRPSYRSERERQAQQWARREEA